MSVITDFVAHIFTTWGLLAIIVAVVAYKNFWRIMRLAFALRIVAMLAPVLAGIAVLAALT